MEYESLKLPILEHFGDIILNEEEHRYFLNGKPFSISVSGIIKNFYIPFNAKDKSLEMTGCEEAAKQLRQEWKNNADRACELGTRVHKFGEVYPFQRHLKPKDGFEKAIVKFWNDLPEHIVPVMTECMMYHQKYLFAGTMDILLYNIQTGEYIIADYKTNKDLFKNVRRKKMTKSFINFLDNPYNHYQIQLSLYQILIEQVTGVKISSRKIIWLLPDGEYKLYDTDDLTGILNIELQKIYN